MSKNRASKRKWKQTQSRKQREAERLAAVRRQRNPPLQLTTVVTKQEPIAPKLDDLRSLGMVEMPKPHRDAARLFEDLSGKTSAVGGLGMEVARPG